MKRWQTILIGLIISVVALYFTFRQANFGAIVDAFRHANYLFLLLATVLLIFTDTLRGYRWLILTEGRLSFADSFWLFNIGFLFNNILPARLGEIARAVLAGRRPRMHFTSALSSIVVERLFDLISVAILIGLILLVLPMPPLVTTAGAIMGTGALTGIIVLALAARYPAPALVVGSRILGLLPRMSVEKAENFLKPFVEGLAGVANWRVFAGGMLISIISWLASGVAAWVFMMGFWPQPPLIMGMVAVAASGIGVAIPAAPSGVGPFEYAIFVAFTAVGLQPDLTRSFALSLHVSNFLVTSILGIIGLMREGTSFSEVARAAESVSLSQQVSLEEPRA